MVQRKRQYSFLAFSLTILCMLTVIGSVWPSRVSAAPSLVQSTSTNGGGTSVAYSSSPIAGHLLVAVCSSDVATTVTGPAGFSTAINESATIGQGIFYKIAIGSESTISCSFSGSGNNTVQLYEYSGIHSYTTFELANATSSTGNSGTISSGTLTTTHANDLIIAAATINNPNGTPITGWTNSFSQRQSDSITKGPKGSRFYATSLDRYVTASGSYSTTGTTTDPGSWRGQIVAFRALAASPVLSHDIVNGAGASVANPTVAMSTLTKTFTCQTATGTLGTASQKIRVSNSTDNPAWSLSIAATGGQSAVWQAGANTYAYNNAAGSGCTGGQLTITPSQAGVSASSGCSTSGVTAGSSGSFTAGSVNAVTLLSAATPAAIDCSWDMQNISLSQKVPANQASGAYNIGLTLTLTAN